MFLTDEARDADTQHAALRDLVHGLQPDDIPLREAPALFQSFAAMERLAHAGKTLMAGRVAESDTWKQQGHPSPADYMAAKIGSTADTARKTLATSKRLRDLPHVDTAVRAGQLSREQADLIADAASHDPDSESDLLDLAATASLAELRHECLRRKAGADPDPKATRERLRKARKVRTHTDPEGAWNLYGRGPLDMGAGIDAALDLVTEELFRNARAEGRTDPREAYRFDALQIVAGWAWDIHNGDTPTWNFNTGNPADPAASEPDSTSPAGERDGNDTGSAGAVHEQDNTPSRPPRDNPPAASARTDIAPSDTDSPRTSGAEPDDVDPAGDGPGATRNPDDNAGATHAGHDHDPAGNRAQRRAARKRRAGPKQQVLVHVSLGALVRGHVQAGERSEIPGQGPIPVDAIRRMLADATVKVLAGPAGAVRTVCHLGRHLTVERLVPTATEPDPPPPSGSRPEPRYLVLVHLDTADLPPPASGTDRCTIAGISPISRAALRTLATDWVIERMVRNSVDLTALTYTGRGLNTAQLMATLWTQPLCSVQGCNRLRVEYDHRTPWATIHETSLDNIDALCGHHHRLKSIEGWALVAGTGKRPFVPPADPRHPDNQPGPASDGDPRPDDTATDDLVTRGELVGAET